MPEGPTIVILKEEVAKFDGKEVIAVTGNTKIDLDRLLHQKATFKSWGKHFLICFDGFTVRIHFLLFGSYLIDETKSAQIRLGLTFPNGQLNMYACGVKILEGDINDHYHWSEDVMNEDWNPKKAKAKLKEVPNKLACDALLEQDIFSGVGNIIKNEVLYRIFVHPKSEIGEIPAKKITEMIDEAKNYSFDFLRWKKQNELKKHWLAHTKKTCKRCDLPIIKEYTGIKKRRSFYCENCQILYQ
ncbi:endonuclease [Flavobacterium noncentrifugens]|uniref:DNA-(apurinic or apyrimidinic site) lyase n=1 Tax=Flavobacterium noncentrifugens TaxID=1128970 RepID=A0A1G8YVZ6_9FLAO|nr:endonuclease [Flavobacterium noncentrifugens]GEP51380.1 endonuclease [Flavobacterium noncentrifugens]SDK06961.1 endonuclease-8 [Flavobacterium noncentrifugens]